MYVDFNFYTLTLLLLSQIYHSCNEKNYKRIEKKHTQQQK